MGNGRSLVRGLTKRLTLWFTHMPWSFFMVTKRLSGLMPLSGRAGRVIWWLSHRQTRLQWHRSRLQNRQYQSLRLRNQPVNRHGHHHQEAGCESQ